jgi:chromate transporter
MTSESVSDVEIHSEPSASSESIPHESYWKLFRRFLRFGFLAWGGPVAQIAMIRQELVDEEHWVSNERFNRVLAVYQVLPGPEAHELCVYFGTVARGRIGGLLAGLGFMLPGFILMMLLSWFYVTYGINSVLFAGAFYGMQAVVGALIVRAIHRIGGHALLNRWLWAIAGLAFAGQLVGIHFALILIASGLIYVLVKREQVLAAGAIWLISFIVVIAVGWSLLNSGAVDAANTTVTTATGNPSILSLFGSGLRTGLLTFGGAYTAIPFLQKDAVSIGNWMTNAQFLDGLALSGILPAPLIIFGTFVGYLGGGWLGGLVVTAGIFVPAFAFTLVGHNLMERLIANTALQSFLDGITAGVVGLIAATTIVLLRATLVDVPTLLIFGIGLFILFQWKSKWNVPVVVLGAGLVGLLLQSL